MLIVFHCPCWLYYVILKKKMILADFSKPPHKYVFYTVIVVLAIFAVALFNMSPSQEYVQEFINSAHAIASPTTTLAAEKSNNTSAADNFGSLTCKNYVTGAIVSCTANGNEAPTNISKVNIHSLLYSGNTTKIFAHLMLWWGNSSHINVDYSSSDSAQVHKQVTDMISRGINGVIMDWYGAGNYQDSNAKLVMNEAQTRSEFTFAILIDQGALKSMGVCEGCDGTSALISAQEPSSETHTTELQPPDHPISHLLPS